jgi:hypothetical protein
VFGFNHPLKDSTMFNKLFAIFALATLLASPSWADEPGSGYFAKDCAHPGGGWDITIDKNGTATVAGDPDVYENVMTSYSFFGDSTPSDFVVAIMFDKKNTPLPPYKGQTGWIEIWKDSKGYYALENGRASKQLKQCTHH